MRWAMSQKPRRTLERYRDFAGAIYPDGSAVAEPLEYTEARTILAVCDRFKCLPSEAMEEGAGILRLMKIEAMGRPPQDEGGGEDLW
jgi:hypothetical protein